VRPDPAVRAPSVAQPVTIPRVVIAAPSSGQGKTSVATGLLGALRAQGLTVSPHKVGPDYIDPGYHSLAAGRPGRNLDPWLVGEHRIAPLFVHGASTPTLADIAVIEGVMGLFDGAAGRTNFASTAHVAQLLEAPVILVVDASAMSRSIAPLVHGFATFDPSVRLGGVIVNRVGSDRHARLLEDALEEVGIPLLGAIRRIEALVTPSRHLGLVPAAERSAEAEATVAALARVVADSVDLAAVRRLAESAPEITADVESLGLVPVIDSNGPVIAIAGGPAFTFGYAETPELLRAAGAKVVTFDPIHDTALPPNTSGVIIGGGFPEIYAKALSDNGLLRAEVAQLADDGAPIAAECAGLLYLLRSLDDEPMCGALDGDATMTPKLTMGYREGVALTDSTLVAAGTRVRGHEFHRTASTPRAGAHPAWRWAGFEPEGFVYKGIHASYLHLNWLGLPGAAQRFVASCRAHEILSEGVRA
jgi:cobyrinic acid a,c-diamide synthase